LASELMSEGKYQESLAVWPNFPDCWTHLYESKRAQLDKFGYEQIKKEFCDRALAACPDTATIYSLCADVAMRYNKWEEAIKLLETALTLRPEAATALVQLGHCYRNKAHKSQDLSQKTNLYKNAKACMKHLREVSASSFKDSLDWEYQDNSNIPTPFELESGNGP